MSDNRSWRHKLQSHNESAISLVRRCVAAWRRAGKDTEGALRELGPMLQSTPRRMRTLFYEDGTPIVTETEWNAMRRHAAQFFLELERKHLEAAEQCKAEYNALLAEQSSSCWEEQKCSEKCGLRGRIASAPQ